MEDLERENKRIRRKLEETKKEKEDEAEQFQVKVKELQEKFKELERKIKDKDKKAYIDNEHLELPTLSKMNILKQENKYLGQELYKKSQELDELKCQLKAQNADDESLYESLNFDSHPLPEGKSCCKQVSSCLRCSIVIMFSVALVVILAFVLPLKILFGEQQ